MHRTRMIVQSTILTKISIDETINCYECIDIILPILILKVMEFKAQLKAKCRTNEKSESLKNAHFAGFWLYNDFKLKIFQLHCIEKWYSLHIYPK